MEGKVFRTRHLGTGVSSKNAHILDVKLQVRLTLHIQQYHKDITAERRWKMTKAAKVVGQLKRQPAYSLSQGMKKIEILFQKETARQQQLPKAVAAIPVVAVCSTRSYHRFPLSHPEMRSITSWSPRGQTSTKWLVVWGRDHRNRPHTIKVWQIYIYIYTNASRLQCMISSLVLRCSAIKYIALFIPSYPAFHSSRWQSMLPTLV